MKTAKPSMIIDKDNKFDILINKRKYFSLNLGLNK